MTNDIMAKSDRDEHKKERNDFFVALLRLGNSSYALKIECFELKLSKNSVLEEFQDDFFKRPLHLAD
ncbi:hypothetical protein P5673_016298 [Acropora cervicornis]|uniref:Uncharacterized protein n=1 Tax=Acropora cervicornis TaxID=6130 RepID=A0AAD9V4P1_ACRCE|nr:hypothetical protein P5673_016298 [Acropora cervicornis]